MFRSYLATAAKHLRKHPLYSGIKIVGLGIGLAAFFVIAAYVRFELSFDRFHEKSDRTFRVIKEDEGNFYLGSNRFAVTPAPLGQALEAELPYVEAATQIKTVEALLGAGEHAFFSDGLYASEAFFEVFSFPMIRGDGRAALGEPETILVTPALAERLFGDADPVGQTVRFTYFSTEVDLTVRGVIAPPPGNSHIAFEFVAPLTLDGNWMRNQDRWGNNSWFTYAAVRDTRNNEEFQEAVADLGHRHLLENDWYRDNDRRTTYIAQPLESIHLRSQVNFEMGATGDIKYVYLFALVALAILFTAGINYTNLATARAVMRAREIGVRKASGAHRSQLVAQFLGESVLLALGALAVALALVWVAWPWFTELMSRSIPSGYLMTGATLAAGSAVALLVGLASGVYPALVLSRFEPAAILRGRRLGVQGAGLRRVLVVGQFAIGVALVFGTLVVQRQIQYMGTAETGVSRDQVVSIRIRQRGVEAQWEALTSEISSIAGVMAVSTSGHVPTNISSQSGIDEWSGNEDGREASLYQTNVGYGFTELLGLNLLEGRGFEPDRVESEEVVLINESAMKALGWDTVEGKTVSFGPTPQRVVGLLQDFNFHSFRQEIAPLAIFLDPADFTRVLVKVETSRTAETLAALSETIGRFAPDFPFEYEFLDEAYGRMYASDQRLASIFGWFTGIALVIACLGLFGLAAFMVQARTKEIGVRKVLGARPDQITMLMVRDLALPVFIASLIGGPLAWLGMQRWLSAFAYRIEPGVGTFLVTLAAVLVVALMTVSWQSFRASTADPVKSLRVE